MRLKLNFLAIKANAMSGANPTPLITLRIPSTRWSMVVAGSCCGYVFHQQGLGNWSELKEWWIALNAGNVLRETCFSLQEIWDWDGGSPSSRTMTLSILLKQHLSGLIKGKDLNVLEWPNESPDFNPIENLWYDLKIAIHQQEPIQLEGSGAVSPWRTGKNPVARCAKIIIIFFLFFTFI